MQYQSYHELLMDEFDRRKQINPAYSLRAYARDLELPAPRLSQVLNKKQGLSVEIAEKVARKLKLSENRKQWFCHSVGSYHSRSYKERNEFKQRMSKYREEAKIYSEMHLEYFKVIAEWYHFAILELTYLTTFQNDEEWMAGMLGISALEVKEAVQRMKTLELIREENGKLIDAFKFLATPSDVPSDSLKKFNSQLILKALAAINEQDVDKREIASNIFSLNRNSIPMIKEKLRTFRRELELEVSREKDKDSVYCLGMQFYELTKEEK